MLERDETLVTARSCKAEAVKALIAIGTSCTFSARFCAVTTISWMPPLPVRPRHGRCGQRRGEHGKKPVRVSCSSPLPKVRYLVLPRKTLTICSAVIL
jgi:hypothetical protein